MTVVLNGQELILPGPVTVLDLLDRLALNRPGVAVEVDRAVVKASDFPLRRLRGGERIEIVTLVGGG